MPKPPISAFLSAIGSIAFVSLLVQTPCHAQASASHHLTEFALNGGGDPAQAGIPASASHRITLDAIGDGLLGPGLSSASHRLDGGFVSFFPPPGEVVGLLFTDNQALAWKPEKSVGRYEVYRGLVSSLASGGTGTCLAPGIAGETASDASLPAVGTGFFYLVTARNRLGEEGTKGFRSTGSERPNPLPCP
jgi:hypothetical protein